MTREEAIKILSKDTSMETVNGLIYYAGFNKEKVVEKIQEAMEMGAKALEKQDVPDTNVGNKWIPCSERLPEEEKGVVGSVYNVTIQDKEKLCKPYSDVKRFNFESKTWQNIYDDEGVIAWQTLPEPYKEGET